jgi:hypothetical protein
VRRTRNNSDAWKRHQCDGEEEQIYNVKKSSNDRKMHCMKKRTGVMEKSVMDLGKHEKKPLAEHRDDQW